MLASLRADGKLTLPAADEEAFLARLYRQPTLPRLALPEDLSLEERAGTPAPHLKIGPPAPRTAAWAVASDRPTAELSFRLRRVADRARRPAERDRRACRIAVSSGAIATPRRRPPPRCWRPGSSARPHTRERAIVFGRYDVARARAGRGGPDAARTPGGGWRPRESCTGKRGTSRCRSRAASTGSIWTARLTSTAFRRRCPSCCGRCGEATPWSASVTAASACCPRSG